VAYLDLGAGAAPASAGETGAPRSGAQGAAGVRAAQAFTRAKTPAEGMLELFLRTQLRAGATLPLIAVLFALALLNWVSGTELALWLLAVLGISGGEVLLCRLLLGGEGPGRRMPSLPPRPERLLLLSEIVHALLWTVPLFRFWEPQAALQHMFIISVLMVVVVVRILIAFSHSPVMLAGSSIISMAIVLRCVAMGEMLYVAMAALTIITHIFLLQLARRLQESALDMLRLQAQREELIRRLKEARDRAEGARRRAEAANRAKSMFLANMSHELRTPLNAIMGFSEIIAREMFGPVPVRQYQEYAADIHRSGQHLLSLINDILDLSRIETGHYSLKEEPVDLGEQGREAIKLLGFRAHERQIRIETHFPAHLPAVLADARAVRQIWLNLLSNAIKFTPAGGRVELSARETPDGGVVMEVADTGTGIPEGELAEITEAFMRGRAAQAQAVEGVGLGLSIVKRLAELHEATVRIESMEGAGTRVRILFPPHRVHAGQGLLEEEEDFLADQGNRRLLALMDRMPRAA
jgi:two-component system cell cycle sensor histidine kinase PleC